MKSTDLRVAQELIKKLPNDPQSIALHKFFTHMTICHTVVPEKKNKKVNYQVIFIWE
jgi:hypothetical protein